MPAPAARPLPDAVLPDAGLPDAVLPAAGRTGSESALPDQARAEVPTGEPWRVDIVVIGAGQAGLSAAHRLVQRGFVGHVPDAGPLSAADPTAAAADRQPALPTQHPPAPGAPHTFLVLDAEDGPGGAWRHRWPTLTMATVNGIHDLPGAAFPDPDPAEPSSVTLPRYFGRYEEMFDLPVVRPVRVTSVEREDDDPAGRLRVRTDRGELSVRAVISATGTWSRPFWPRMPGQETFRGRQIHTRGYDGPDEHAGHRVAVVGGGISGVGHVMEIAEVADTFWYTRTPPRWSDAPFDAEAGRGVEHRVTQRVERGLRPLPVVAETGLFLTPTVYRAMAAGVLDRRPMFTAITPTGVVEQDGSETEVDTIVWATGFRHELRHLQPLGIRTPAGGVLVRGTEVVAEPRLHLVGYGPAASTVGATRAARRAVAAIVELLRRPDR